MRRIWIYSTKLMVVCLVILALSTTGAQVTHAQDYSFTVNIGRPSEGETFYAGPFSLLYNIPISGWVTTHNTNPVEMKIRLEVFRGTEITNSLLANPYSDGTFVFYATVNPSGSEGQFPSDVKDCGNYCHRSGQFSLPSGHLTLRITATDMAGRQAVAERHITVDRSGYATVPVQVVLADSPEQAVVGVPVNGSTFLYMWRARSASAATDARGVANVTVEALSEAPTRYVFRVEPSIVDGILYESVKSVEITLPPGATFAPPITLQAGGRTGKISGILKGMSASAVTIHAILLPSGKNYSAQTSATGTFEFPNLPIGSYLITANDRALAAQGYSSKNQTVDLSQTPSTSITIPVVPTQRSPALQGSVRDALGNRLPFAWVAIEKSGLAQRNVPDSGNYTLGDLPNEPMTVVASAPGYYHLAQVVNPSAGSADFLLTRRPETKSIPWGSSEIVVPPESKVAIDQQQITLEYGWLWGSGGDNRPLTIRAANADIVLAQGKFAIEYLPPNSAGWLYVLEGSATVRSDRTVESFRVNAGEMVALTEETRWVVVPIDAMVIATLHTDNDPPIEPVWESTLEAQLRDRLAQMGIGAVQTITFVTYSAVLVLLIGLPLGALWFWRRNITRSGDKKSS